MDPTFAKILLVLACLAVMAWALTASGCVVTEVNVNTDSCTDAGEALVVLSECPAPQTEP